MNAKLIGIGTLTFGLLFAPQAHASWTNIASPAELKALHTDTTLDGGAALYGHFYEGGFGTVIDKGERVRAPWHLNGNQEVCVEVRKGLECFRYQRTGDFATEYRAIRVRDGAAIPMRVERGVPEY